MQKCRDVPATPGGAVPTRFSHTRAGIFWEEKQLNNVMSHVDLIFRQLHLITEIALQP